MNDDPAAQILLASVEAILDDAGPAFSRPPIRGAPPVLPASPAPGAASAPNRLPAVVESQPGLAPDFDGRESM